MSVTSQLIARHSLHGQCTFLPARTLHNHNTLTNSSPHPRLLQWRRVVVHLHYGRTFHLNNTGYYPYLLMETCSVLMVDTMRITWSSKISPDPQNSTLHVVPLYLVETVVVQSPWSSPSLQFCPCPLRRCPFCPLRSTPSQTLSTLFSAQHRICTVHMM